MQKYTQSTYIQKRKKKSKEWIGLLAVVALWFFSGYGALPDNNVSMETILTDKAYAKEDHMLELQYQPEEGKSEVLREVPQRLHEGVAQNTSTQPRTEKENGMPKLFKGAIHSGENTKGALQGLPKPELATTSPGLQQPTADSMALPKVPPSTTPSRLIIARITGYNTVEAQTDQTPCISASGHNICGRNDVVACPRNIKLGTKVEIGGKMYVCLDRLAAKFDNRFDISCDRDFECPYKVTGTKEVKIWE